MSGDEATALEGLARVEPPTSLPSGWCWATLDELAAPEKNAVTDGPFGSHLKTAHYTESGPRVVRLQNVGHSVFKDARAHISEKHYASLLRHSVRPGDLVIAALGEELPRACVIPDGLGPAIVKADCIRFRPDATVVLPQFLNYALNAPDTRRRTAAVVHGVGRPRLTLGQIKGISVPVAPLNSQRRIADALDELYSDLEAGVAALERVRQKLKLYRASVLKAAVEGALTAEWRAQHQQVEPASPLLQRILAERRRRWEAEQIARFKGKGQEPPKNWKATYSEPVCHDATVVPPVPRGWTVASLDALTTRITSGSRDWRQYCGVGSGTFLMAQNVRPGRLDLGVRQAVNPPPADPSCERSLVAMDDLLVTIVGANTGDVCRVREALVEHYVCQSVALIRPVDRRTASYLDCYCNSPGGAQLHYQRYIYGAGRPHLSFEQLKRTPVLLPSLAEQDAIVEAVEDQLSVIDHLEADIDAKLKSAQSLRQAVLRHAFSGKLVPQDPNDEPASELLKRIAAEREARVREATAAKGPGRVERTRTTAKGRTRR